MSGIFIKDMFLPAHCGACPLALLDSYGYRSCYVTDSDVTRLAVYEERSGDCPMEEREE